MGNDDEKRIADALGLSEDDIQAANRMADSSFLNIPDPPSVEQPGPRVICTVMSDDITSTVTSQFGTSPVLKVKDEQGIPATIPLGSKSLRLQYFRLARKGSLVGRKLAIWKEFYSHEKWGKTLGYRVELLSDIPVSSVFPKRNSQPQPQPQPAAPAANIKNQEADGYEE